MRRFTFIFLCFLFLIASVDIISSSEVTQLHVLRSFFSYFYFTFCSLSLPFTRHFHDFSDQTSNIYEFFFARRQKIEFQIKATAIERITTKKSDKEVPMQKSGFKKEGMFFVLASVFVCVPSSWMIETENKKNKLAKVFLSNRASHSLSFSISANFQRDEVQKKSAQAQPNLNERNISKSRNIFMECHESR